jgi:hypothetical protein
MMLGILNTLVGPVTEILDKVVVDQDEKNRLAFEIATLADKQAHEIALAQIEVNKAEAENAGSGWFGFFRSAWRPFVAWSCAIAMVWHFLGVPIILFIATMSGSSIPPLPEFDMGSLMTVLLGLLGLGGMRSLEKIRGIE